ncbi:MAG: insulinase family protein [Propionibacteriaceae bacterium]|jgi:predicted Zn-dependent peptidase|nr:insulinase family protein [Propionibacteriaceae bacterium]
MTQHPQHTAWPRPSVVSGSSWTFPHPEVTRFDNGLTLLAYHLPGQYILSCDLVLETPLNAEQASQEGVATIAARALNEGSAGHPGSALAQALERVGAQFDAVAGPSTTQCVLDAPATSLREALTLFAEAIVEPDFAPDDIARVVANRLAEIDQKQSHGSYVASRALREALVDHDSRFARPVGGTATTVATITSDHVRAYHRRMYHPYDATIVIAGDLTDVRVGDIVDHVFGQWRPAQATVEPRAATPGLGARQVIDRSGSVQADIRFGWFGVDQKDPRWTDLQVALTIMGGAFTSRLNHALREERGYTYGISMGARPFRVGGLIELATSTRTDVAGAAIDEAQEILATREPFTQTEVTRAVDYLTYSAPLGYDTAEAVAAQGAGLVAGRLPLDHITSTLRALRQVTADTAMAAYRSLVDVDASSIIVVGDADSLDGVLPQRGSTH